MPRLIVQIARTMRSLGWLTAILALAIVPTIASAQTSFAQVVAQTQPRMVKIYGAGGLRGLEAYQSGLLVSAEGHILTVWSYVLDSDVITIMLDDGRKFSAELTGIDPQLEIALLKIDATDLPHFDLTAEASLETGDRVLAFCNLYNVATGNEPTSVLHGQVAALTSLAARRGAYQTPYQGPVYVLDAMTNNPGAAGGALTNRRGEFAGLLGKELRSSLNNTWLNYAIPVNELAPAVADLMAGRSRPADRPETAKRPKQFHTAATLGIVLVPDFLPKTPPFIEDVRPASPAAMAGLKSDDLILFVNGRLIASCAAVIDELTYIDELDSVQLTVQRGRELVEVELTPR